VVRPKEEFTTFRYHDVGEKGHILRLAGKGVAGLGIRKRGLSAKTMPTLKTIHWLPIPMVPEK